MCNVFAIVYKLSRGCKNNDPRKKVDTKSVNDSKFLQNAKIGRKIKKRDKVQNTANFEAFSFFCHPKLLLERHGVTKLVVTAKQVMSQFPDPSPPF